MEKRAPALIDDDSSMMNAFLVVLTLLSLFDYLWSHRRLWLGEPA